MITTAVCAKMTKRSVKIQPFFKDSTYSTKGYTSISVREPLENLRAAVPPSQPTIQVLCVYCMLILKSMSQSAVPTSGLNRYPTITDKLKARDSR